MGREGPIKSRMLAYLLLDISQLDGLLWMKLNVMWSSRTEKTKINKLRNESNKTYEILNKKHAKLNIGPMKI